jgi:hypothetical protein
MRVYVPTTVAGLRAAIAAGAVTAVGGVAFAVTPSLRAEYEGADDEEFEYLAMHDAAVASLRLIAADGAGSGPAGGDTGALGTSEFGAPAALRVVIAADVDSAEQRPDLDRAAVVLKNAVPWSAVAAVHLDSADAGPAVRAAAAVVDAADLGDPDAEFVLGTAEDIDLCWFHPSEVSFLIAELGG